MVKGDIALEGVRMVNGILLVFDIGFKIINFQNLHKHEIVLKSALVNLIKAVLFLAGEKIDNENIEIMFDDSIIEDKDKEYQRDFQAVSSGIMQKWEFRVKHYGEDEKSAKAKCAEDENYGDEE